MQRTWGRVTDIYGNKTWQVVTTDTSGFDDYVWVTTLIQCLKLNLGESPFFANYGIPARHSVVTQIAPDYYVQRTQQQFARHFANLMVAKSPHHTNPTYNINLVTSFGSKIATSIPV